MVSVTFSGPTVEHLAQDAKAFADRILGQPTQVPPPEASEVVARQAPIGASRWGYLPAGVGYPHPEYSPIDDGSEWDQEAITDWIERVRQDGRRVVQALAQGCTSGGTIDPRVVGPEMGLPGYRWSGTWTGPRRQAQNVKAARRLRSWPYGHTYAEPRRLWMHPVIAERVLKALAAGREG